MRRAAVSVVSKGVPTGNLSEARMLSDSKSGKKMKRTAPLEINEPAKSKKPMPPSKVR